MRYLSVQQTPSALRRGAAIEQMLTRTLRDEGIRWLRISRSPTSSGLALRLHCVRDDGNPDFLDVYVFQPLDGGEGFGEGRLVGLYPDAEAVLEAAVTVGGRPDRWVNAGVIQDEYADLQSALL